MTNPHQLIARVRHFCSRWPQHPRNGKVARLPEPVQEQINQMLDDGLRYRDIIEKLRQPGAAPLPYALSEMNISNWLRGGYAEWREEQFWKSVENSTPEPIQTNPKRSEPTKG